MPAMLQRIVPCFFLCACAAFAKDTIDAQTGPSAADVARQMAEVPLVREVRLSPNSEWVAYQITRRSVAANSLTQENHLQQVAQGSESRRLPNGASGIQWCPDSNCLIMILGPDST